MRKNIDNIIAERVIRQLRETEEQPYEPTEEDWKEYGEYLDENPWPDEPQFKVGDEVYIDEKEPAVVVHEEVFDDEGNAKVKLTKPDAYRTPESEKYADWYDIERVASPESLDFKRENNHNLDETYKHMRTNKNRVSLKESQLRNVVENIVRHSLREAMEGDVAGINDEATSEEPQFDIDKIVNAIADFALGLTKRGDNYIKMKKREEIMSEELDGSMAQWVQRTIAKNQRTAGQFDKIYGVTVEPFKNDEDVIRYCCHGWFDDDKLGYSFIKQFVSKESQKQQVARGKLDKAGLSHHNGEKPKKKDIPAPTAPSDKDQLAERITRRVVAQLNEMRQPGGWREALNMALKLGIPQDKAMKLLHFIKNTDDLFFPNTPGSAKDQEFRLADGLPRYRCDDFTEED